MTSIIEKQTLCVQALKACRGEQVRAFEIKFGRPEDTARIERQLWWDEPSYWNPAMTPRQELERLRLVERAYDQAIVWVLEQIPF